MNLKAVSVSSAVILAAVFLACIFLMTRAGDEVKVMATASPGVVRIGDPVKFKLEIVIPKGWESEPPAPEKALDGFNLKSSYHFRRQCNGNTEISYTFSITRLESGLYTVPPILFKWKKPYENTWQETASAPVALEFKSVLDDAAVVLPRRLKTSGTVKRPAHDSDWIRAGDEETGQTESRMVFAYKMKEPPNKIRRTTAAADILKIVAWATGILGVLAAGIILILKRVISREEYAQRADILSLEKLGGMKARDYVRGHAEKEFYSDLSGAIRDYVSGRFGLSPIERTAREFARELSGIKELTEEERQLLEYMITHCDKVKFSGYIPKEKEMEDILSLARESVRELEKRRMLKEGAK